MKKINRLFLVLLIFALLTACGAASTNEATADTATAYSEAATEDLVQEETVAVTGETQRQTGITEGNNSDSLSERIIYSAYAEIETTDFDASIDAVYALMDRYEAFLENSSVNGSNLTDSYSGVISNRSAAFTIRVPREHYSAMTSALDTIGNVTHLSSDAENITAQYTDTESQLKAYELQEERLLEILEQAGTVEDMITLESRLSEIRYQKEALTAQLKNWDNQVDYSTVTINIQEVQVLTPEPQEEMTYWQQVGDGFLSTIHWIGRAAKALFRIFVAALPILIPVGVVVLVVVLLCRRKKKASKPSDSQNSSERREP